MTGRTLNVGAGMTAAGDVTLDVLAHVDPDVQATATHLPFVDESFSRVIMDQVLEHIPHDDVPELLTEVYRILLPGGALEARVPHAATRLADQDPTHRSRWTYRTPEYYADGNFSWYYDDRGFDFALDERTVVVWVYPELPLSGVRSKLLQCRNRLFGRHDELLYKPHVAGSIHFTLVKRPGSTAGSQSDEKRSGTAQLETAGSCERGRSG